LGDLATELVETRQANTLRIGEAEPLDGPLAPTSDKKNHAMCCGGRTASASAHRSAVQAFMRIKAEAYAGDSRQRNLEHSPQKMRPQ
jgi:hypothetical protein